MNDISMLFVRSEFDAWGDKVDIYRTTAYANVTCPYCADGNCEQEVHRCDAYGCDVIVHDRPAETN